MTTAKNTQDPANGPERAAARERDRRNRAIAAILVGLAILFFVVTIVQLGGNIAQRTH